MAVVALSLTSPVSATADEGPLQDTVGSAADGLQGAVDDTVGQVTPGVTGGGTAKSPGTSTGSTAPTPSSDDDSDGHETEDPAAPDHGGATIVRGGAAGQEVATVGDSRARVEDDDSTRSDATLLALGGQEVLGAHADSRKEDESHFGDPLAPLCEGSEGQVCLRVLYADAWATDQNGTSSSHSQSGVADVCLGGDDADPSAACSGPVSTGVAGSEGRAERDQRSGRTTASSSSDVADVCVQQDPATGCALGADALHSEGGSDSGGAEASADRDSYLLALDAGGEEQGRVGDPEALALPPGCPEGSSLLCVFLNQGESYVAKHVAGHAQEALHLSVLPGNLDLVVELSRTESLVHNDGGETTVAEGGARPSVKGVGSGGPGHPGSVAGLEGLLPNTGGVWSGLLALGLLGVGAGALLAARAQRRVGGLA
jgi:hypothetical protein